MKIYRKSIKSNNYIVTLNIGSKYLNDWSKYSLPLWLKYCKKHDLGLISFNKDLISKQSKYYKKKQWQKLLIGYELLKADLNIKNICYLDSDILINFYSPNIFNFHHKSSVSLVSQFNNIPYDDKLTRKKISIFRNTFYSKKYPLNSAIHMNISQIYKYHNLEVQKDFCCTGLFIINLEKYANLFKSFFYKYNQNISSITDGGEEAYMNYDIHKNCKVNFIDYRFQALWVFEMANYYPHLYKYKNIKNNLIIQSVENSLINNYFLHFAGSWYESNMWKNSKILKSTDSLKIIKNLNKINTIEFNSKPAGVIKPNK